MIKIKCTKSIPTESELTIKEVIKTAIDHISENYEPYMPYYLSFLFDRNFRTILSFAIAEKNGEDILGVSYTFKEIGAVKKTVMDKIPRQRKTTDEWYLWLKNNYEH